MADKIYINTRADKMNELIKKIESEINLLHDCVVTEKILINFLAKMKNLTWFIQYVAEIEEKDVLEKQCETIRELIK